MLHDDVVNVLHHRRSSGTVDSEIHYMAFEGNIMTASSQMVVTRRPLYWIQPKELQFVIIHLQPISSHPIPNRVKILLSVSTEQSMNECQVELKTDEVEYHQQIKFVMIAPTLRNDFRQ